ncbi:complex I assembly factor TMEM126B, mitochondrial [Suncus etruscus]|uniref:complex I assembly factor TMEM126B, mitochondrial n=1 Tax=Suncus etruscus TaxID=109475 RepID=UPI0021103DB7|nr:complex I assembly factor TMEM126B, mitochondrial [Suncus etruscus]
MAALGRKVVSDPRDSSTVPGGAGEAPKDLMMAAYTQSQSDLYLDGGKLRRSMIFEIIEKKLEYLKNDKTLNIKRTVFFGATASLSGILANFVFRSSFKVQHDALKTYASLVSLPFLSTVIANKFLVTDALYSGNISRENCILRSSLVAILCGVLYPSGLAFSKSGRLAVKYHTVPLPPKGRVLLHWMLLCQTHIKVMAVPLVFQTCFGIVHGLYSYALFQSIHEETVNKD